MLTKRDIIQALRKQVETLQKAVTILKTQRDEHKSIHEKISQRVQELETEIDQLKQKVPSIAVFEFLDAHHEEISPGQDCSVCLKVMQRRTNAKKRQAQRQGRVADALTPKADRGSYVGPKK